MDLFSHSSRAWKIEIKTIETQMDWCLLGPSLWLAHSNLLVFSLCVCI